MLIGKWLILVEMIIIVVVVVVAVTRLRHLVTSLCFSVIRLCCLLICYIVVAQTLRADDDFQRRVRF